MKTASTLLLILAASVVSASAAAPVWDSSGNGQLNGTYYFRQVVYQADSSGNASAFYAYYGNIVFNGTGSYSITAGTFLEETSQGVQSNPSATGTGTYSVSASGFGFLSSPLISGQNVYFLVNNHILIGSETESGNNDLFIAAPAASLTNASFTGSYTISAFFPGGTAASSGDATYQLSPSGSGTLGNVSIAGFTGAGNSISQNSSGVKYSFSNGANIITWPTNTNANFYSGQEFMYLSPDSNFVFGGSPNGFDMFVGVRNASGSAPPLSGLYYEAGLEENENTGVDSFYGAFNASSGNVIGHERLLYSAYTALGLTYQTTYPAGGGSTYTDPSNTVQYTIGQGGTRISYGTGGYLGIGVALQFNPPSPTGSVYIDPTGIVNTASSAPYTAGISPGDFLTFYNGVNLSSTTVVASTVPYPTTLNNVQVLIDGAPAPIYYVSPTQVSVIVPYGVNTFPPVNGVIVASIQIVNNNVKSNIVTTYVNQTTPGVFTSSPVGGIGVAAMLDFPAAGGYFIVGANQPANPGDSVALYLTGLGTPYPSNPDGAAGPLAGDTTVQTINVDVSGTDVGTLAYSGLAPGIAGLYQINFTVPIAAVAGNNSLGITGPDSYSNESIIPIGTGGTAAARTSAEPTPALRRKALPRMTTPVSR